MLFICMFLEFLSCEQLLSCFFFHIRPFVLAVATAVSAGTSRHFFLLQPGYTQCSVPLTIGAR